MIRIEIDSLMKELELGSVVKEPIQVTGGLLHKMYRVHTDKGTYAVKILNPEIMKRQAALHNTVNSEKVAAAFQTIIPVVSALEIRGTQLHERNGAYYMIFDWVEGVLPEEDGTTMFEWDKYGDGLQEYEEAWAIRLQEFLSDIKAWYQAACEAQEILAETMVISHRDLDPKNVMWNGDTPWIIDWEAAGYVNPYQELLEVVNYWADDGKGGLLKEHFDALLDAYTQHMKLENVDWTAVFAGSFLGMLGWLEYNVKRAFGIEAATAEEIQLGKEQILSTIEALYHYENKLKMIKGWLYAMQCQ